MCECKKLVIQSSKEKKYRMNVRSVLIELFTKIEFMRFIHILVCTKYYKQNHIFYSNAFT